jgi:hypothetical protein
MILYPINFQIQWTKEKMVLLFDGDKCLINSSIEKTCYVLYTYITYEYTTYQTKNNKSERWIPLKDHNRKSTRLHNTIWYMSLYLSLYIINNISWSLAKRSSMQKMPKHKLCKIDVRVDLNDVFSFSMVMKFT